MLSKHSVSFQPPPIALLFLLGPSHSPVVIAPPINVESQGLQLSCFDKNVFVFIRNTYFVLLREFICSQIYSMRILPPHPQMEQNGEL